MARLSRSQEQARSRIEQVRTSRFSPEQTASAILEALEIAVPSDGQRLFGLDSATLLINRLLAAREPRGASLRFWLSRVYLSTPEIEAGQFPSLMRAGIMVAAFSDHPEKSWGFAPWMRESVPPTYWRRYYHEYATPLGGTIFASFKIDGRWIASLSLYRRERNHPYQPGEVAFLRLLAPTIGHALRASLERERAELDCREPGCDGHEVSGVMIYGDDGRVCFSTPAAERWSDLVLDAERAGHEPLPAAAWSLMASLRRGAADCLGTSLVVPTRVGMVRLEASRGVDDGDVALVFTPEHRPAPPEVPPGWPLTPAERQVIGLLLQGLSNRQISERLFIAENTVQAHLRHSYDKLGVHSRTQLLSRLFQQAYLPAFASEG